MVEKAKDSPLPAKTTSVQSKEGVERKTEPKSASEQPTFVRGTIDPPTKK